VMPERFDVATLEALIEDGRRRELPSEEIAAEILVLSQDPVWAKAMAHPTRGRILRLLREHGELSPARAASMLAESLGTVSYHFRSLANLGLIELCETIPRRGAVEHVYRLADRTNGASAASARRRPRAAGSRHPRP
jgi:DNA-binding transcriptional ArsR family regulator